MGVSRGAQGKLAIASLDEVSFGVEPNGETLVRSLARNQTPQTTLASARSWGLKVVNLSTNKYNPGRVSYFRRPNYRHQRAVSRFAVMMAFSGRGP